MPPDRRYPTKTQREDALLLADMILTAGLNDADLPIVTDERAWLLAATLKFLVTKRGGSVD